MSIIKMCGFMKNCSREMNGRLRISRTTINNNLNKTNLYSSVQRNFSRTYSSAVKTKQFMDIFPYVVNDFINDPKYSDIPEAVNHFKNALMYTVPTGRITRAMSLLHCYENMEDPRNLTPENIKLVNILGWCIELQRAAILVVDDMVDNSETRRGRKCWYKNGDLGTRAMLDAIALESYVYLTLKKHFSHLPMYVPAIHLIQETTMNTALGEILGTMPLHTKEELTVNCYTMRRFQVVTRYKTTSPSFELPYNLARCFSNKLQAEISPKIQDMLIRLGEFFQIQNDFLDCYGDTSTDYKTGNDIAEGRCTWLIATALERANSEQRQLLEAHYGRKDAISVEIVRELYELLKIPKAYAMYEEDAFDYIEKNSDEVSKLTSYELMFKRLC